jgi:hypothetical protein
MPSQNLPKAIGDDIDDSWNSSEVIDGQAQAVK